MILDICNIPELLKVIRIINIVITIIKIVVPIILIISAMIELTKAVSNSELNKVSKSIINKVLAAVLVFLIPTFVNIIVSFVDPNNNSYLSCLSSATQERIQQLYNENMNNYISEAKEKLNRPSYQVAYSYLKNIKDESIRENYLKELETIKKEIEEKEKKEEEEKKSHQVTPGITKGNAYNVSEEDLRFLANVGYCEQGSIDGIKAEVSLAANLFELQSKYTTVVDYVRKSGWFACAKTTKVAPIEAIDAVRDVIVNGNRTLPLYINEHDCYDCNKSTCSNGNRGDICKIVIDGRTYESMSDIKNRDNYISGKTIIYNKYGGVYTFYCFPSERSDPFGYTASAYKKYNP
jgi:hypothetical protein